MNTQLVLQRFAIALASLGMAWSALAAPTPSTNSGQVGVLVGKILSREHYRQLPLNDAVSAQFLKLYLESLDYNRMVFLQSDVDEFQKYATILDDETLRGNVQPGFDIFARYLQRVEQRMALIQELLKEDFTFEEEENIVLDRHEAIWPASDEELRKLWRQRVGYEVLLEKLNGKKLAEAKAIVGRRYTRFLHSVHEEDADSVMQRYLTSLARAYDPHSDYMSQSELEQFAISMKLSLVGIGAVLSWEDGYAKVIAIVPGGPADLDKRLKVNDRITGVGQGDGPLVDVVDMKLNKAVEMIRGEKNTPVRIQVIPAGATDPSTRAEIKLKRDEIKLTESEAKAKLIEHKDANGNTQRIGYIDLPSFYGDQQTGKSTTRDVAGLIGRLKSQKIDGLILDLRRNGGGILGEAIGLTGLFIKRGPVVQIKDSHGAISVLPDDDASVMYDGPMVVLVSHVSASASEILAAALQDYGRAVIVGEQSTFGKGTVQRVEELERFLPPNTPKGGALKITTQKFYRISGGSTQYKGVLSDVQLPSELDYAKYNEASLKNALSYDDVPQAAYVPVNAVASSLPALRKRSQERIAKDPEYDYIRDDMARMKARLDEKSVSLNEVKRRQQQKADKDRYAQRKRERAERKVPPLQVTEITLQSISQGSTNAPALTRKVLDDARAILDENSDDETRKDPLVDPEFDEGLNVMSDLIELSHKTSGD